MLTMHCMSHLPSGIPVDSFFQRPEMLLQLFQQPKRSRAHTEEGTHTGLCDTTHVAISMRCTIFAKHTLGQLWKHLLAGRRHFATCSCVLTFCSVHLDAIESLFKRINQDSTTLNDQITRVYLVVTKVLNLAH